MTSEAHKGCKSRIIDECPGCGGPVGCGMTNGAAMCWCFALPHAMPMDADGDRARCYCRTCLTKLIEDRVANSSG